MYDCCVMNKNKYVFAKSDTVYWQRKKEGKKKEEMEGGEEWREGKRGREGREEGCLSIPVPNSRFCLLI